MNGSRQRFEAWMRERQGYPYAAQYANLMWAAWQAAERQALERAAKVCDALEARISKVMVDAHERRGAPIDGGYLNACDDCAEGIRALIEQDAPRERHDDARTDPAAC